MYISCSCSHSRSVCVHFLYTLAWLSSLLRGRQRPGINMSAQKKAVGSQDSSRNQVAPRNLASCIGVLVSSWMTFHKWASIIRQMEPVSSSSTHHRHRLWWSVSVSERTKTIACIPRPSYSAAHYTSGMLSIVGERERTHLLMVSNTTTLSGVSISLQWLHTPKQCMRQQSLVSQKSIIAALLRSSQLLGAGFTALWCLTVHFQFSLV